MTFRQWLSKKIAGSNYSSTNGSLTDLDRQNALAVRRQKQALKQAERQIEFMERLNNLEMKVNPKESFEETLVKQVLPLLLSKIQNNPNSINNNLINNDQQQIAYVNLSEEQVKNIISLNPKLKQHADKFTDEQIKEFIIQQMPSLTKESIDKIIVEVRK